MDMALQWSLGMEISSSRELVMGRLFMPAVKAVTFYQRYFDDDDDDELR